MTTADSLSIDSASRLRWSALDQEAEMRIDSAVALLEHAVTVDPGYFPAWHDYLRLTYEQGAEESARFFPRRTANANGVARCAAIVAQFVGEGWPAISDPGMQQLTALAGARRGSNSCLAYFLAINRYRGEDSAARISRQLRQSAAVVALEPRLGAAWLRRMSVLAEAGQPRAAETIARDGLAADLHPLERVSITLTLAAVLRQRGDTASARQLTARLRSAVARDGRPGMRFEFARLAFGDPISDLRAMATLARLHGDRMREAEALQYLGHESLDRGDPAAALRAHDREIALLRGTGSARLQQRAYVRRGRALSKLGRWRDAETDLLRAIELGRRVTGFYFLAEAYHNLAHTHESAGRWANAARAADSFAVVSRRIPHLGTGMAIMGLHDGGTIRWKAGWHAAARRTFAEMVREIEATGREPHWAGEYYEREGDLARAIHYYRRATTPGFDPTLSLRGLVRVYSALGQSDSAEAAARRHDSLRTMWPPLETPLLPVVLARRGRLNEAISTTRAWAQRQTANRNVHGATIAKLQLAELLAEAGNLRAALNETEAARAHARDLRLTAELIHAQRLAGSIRARLGDIAGGLRLLRAAARSALDHPTAGEIAATHTALGDVLAIARLPAQALAAYARAAAAQEDVTRLLHSDVDRVRFRAQQLAPYDGAVRVALALATRPISSPTTTAATRQQAIETLFHWSARRKTVALRFALDERATSSAREVPAPTLANVQKRLAADEAVLDYIVLKDGPAVMTITPRAATIVRLPVAEDSLRSVIERWRRRMVTSYAGQIDLRRSRFDYAAAHMLYRALLEPALAQSGNRPRRLIISADGPLHYLPFEALVMSAPAAPRRANDRGTGTRYVLDSFEVAYAPSAALTRPIPASAGPMRQLPRLLLVAGEAPAAPDEARQIAGIWPANRVVTITSPRATESAVRRAAAFGILHLATHARADDRDPLASYVRLRGDAEHDGYYHVSEITGGSNTPELVVLSGCETVSGPSYRGEGLLGLARAFLTTGSRTVIATQWPVGAPNAELMRYFYRDLAAGNDAVTALSRARRELRRRPEYANPLFWAGTILIGV